MVANVKGYAMQFLFYILYIMRCYYSRRFFEWNLGEENALQHPLSDTRYIYIYIYIYIQEKAKYSK